MSQISVLHDIIKKPELQNKELSRAGDWVPVVSDWMMDLLREGLGKRIELLSIEPWTPKEVSIIITIIIIIIILTIIIITIIIIII